MRPVMLFLAVACLIAGLAGAVWIGRRAEIKTATKSGPHKSAEQAAAAEEKIEPPEINLDGPQPKVVVDSKLFKFGKMALQSTQKHRFLIKNEGPGTLVLKAGVTTCKCTSFTVSPSEVPAGGSAEAELAWKPEAPSPTFEQTAELLTNDADRQVISLKVSGEVVESVVLAPDGTWQSEPFPTKDEPTFAKGRLFSNLVSEFKILSTESSSEFITIDVKPASEEDIQRFRSKSGYEIVATIDPRIPVGRFQETITLKTDLADADSFEISVVGTRTGPVQVIGGAGLHWNASEHEIALGRFVAQEGKRASMSVILADTPEGAMIESAESEDSILKLSVEQDENFRGKKRKLFKLTLEVPAEIPPRTVARDKAIVVTLKTTHPEAPEIKLNCYYISF